MFRRCQERKCIQISFDRINEILILGTKKLPLFFEGAFFVN